MNALPNGRRAGETFASGFAPENGADKRGTTALLNSMNKINYKNFANGINFNIKLDASSYECDDGKSAWAACTRCSSSVEVCRFRPICWILRF